MKRALFLVAGLLALSLFPASAADEKTFPAKNPVIKYWIPDMWTSEVDPTDGSVSISSDDERISIVFVELPVEATMELCKRMEQKMVRRLQDAKEVHPAKEQVSDGLGGYTTSYTGSVDGRQANMTVILFKDGKNRSILGVVFMADHATMPKEQDEKLEAFMKSLKSTAK